MQSASLVPYNIWVSDAAALLIVEIEAFLPMSQRNARPGRCRRTDTLPVSERVFCRRTLESTNRIIDARVRAQSSTQVGMRRRPSLRIQRLADGIQDIQKVASAAYFAHQGNAREHFHFL